MAPIWPIWLLPDMPSICIRIYMIYVNIYVCIYIYVCDTLTHSLTHSPPPFVCVCARACACVCVCVSLSVAPLLPPTGPVHPAALRSIQKPRRRSQGPHWPRGASGRARLGEPKPENTRRKSPGHVAGGSWGCACICVFAETVGVFKKRKKRKKRRFFSKDSSV